MMRLVFVAALVFSILPATARAQQRSCPSNDYLYRYQSRVLSDALSPGVSWEAWADLLGQHWSNSAIASRQVFDAADVKKALALVSFAEGLPSIYYGDTQNYEPIVPPAPTDQSDYNLGTNRYNAGDWQGAIGTFDEVVANPKSPYRSAAAYTAARAALKDGHFYEAVDRIDAILRDPSLVEFHLATAHLLGTMAWRTGTVALALARLAEISHLLVTPSALACGDVVLARLRQDAENDLSWYLSSAYSLDRTDGINVIRRRAVDLIATIDPVLDLARVLGAPTLLDRDFGWFSHRPLPPTQDPWQAELQQAWIFAHQDEDALTNHARERWLATRNPLWGLALAKRTADDGDITRVRDMLQSFASLPATQAVTEAIPAFQWKFRQHLIRLELMNGRLSDAIADLPHSSRFGDSRYMAAKQAILDGGVRYFLAKFDLDDARRWAAAASSALSEPVDARLQLLLASAPEAVASAESSDFARAEMGLRAAFDLLPARRLIALAESRTLSLNNQRALFAAGWLRLYALGHWEEAKGLLPALRSLYPELAGDIDAVNAAWLDDTRRHLVVRMLLRSPGFSLRSFWVRDLPEQGSYADRTMSLFAIDEYNPNDGNWWCPLDIDQMKIDLVKAFFLGPVEGANYVRQNGEFFFFQTDRVWPVDLGAELRMADRIIAWHPLFKDVDFNELAALSRIESGPRSLSEAALQWGENTNWFWHLFGTDELLPETLHLAVRSTRFGCRSAGSHADYSRAAFIWLRQNYPDSSWTAQTPYWFATPGRGD